MRQINVVVHREDGTWWAESDDLPGFSALESTLDSLRIRVAESVRIELDDEPFKIVERDESGAALNAASVFTPAVSRWWTSTEESRAPMAEWFSRMGAVHVAAGVPA